MTHQLPAQPFRVAVLLEGRFPVISETFVIQQIAALRDLGCQVEVLAKKPGKIFANPDLDRYPMVAEAVVALPAKRDVMSLLRWALALLPTARLLLRRPTWALLFQLGPRKLFKSFGLAAALKQPRAYDAIIAHFGPTGLWALQLKELGLINGPVYTIFHGYDISRYVKEQGERVYDGIWQKGAGFIAVSEFFKSRLIKLGANPAATIVLPMGIPIELFPYRQPQKVLNRAIHLVFVGRLTEKKGVIYALQALGQLKDKYDFKFTIAGDGELRTMLEAESKRLGLQERTEFLGVIGQVRVAELLESADIFVAPCVTAQNGDQEGLPLTIKEAMARGVPVVTTTHGGMQEFITHEENGMLAPERDATALAQHIATLIEDADLREHLSLKARKTVETRYNVKILNQYFYKYLQSNHYKTINNVIKVKE